MENHDKLIIRILVNPTKNLVNKNLQRKILKKYPNILEYLNNRYTDSFSLNETIRRIQYHIEEHPKCPICGKYVNYFGIQNGIISFGQTCSKKCSNILHYRQSYETKIKKYGDYAHKEKRKKTCLIKYGVDHVWKSKEIHDKTICTIQQKYGVKSTFQLEKSKNTLYKHYGVDNPMKSKEIQERLKQTLLKKYGVTYIGSSPIIKNKIHDTLINKYGVINPFQIESTKQKIKNTWISKYGVDNPMKCEEIKQKTYNTKENNHSWSTSKIEENLYTYIKEKFPNVERQYKDKERYPWFCDFYIPELDYFIELNGTWTHGKHAFSFNNKEDLYVVEQWKKKGKEHPFYNTALKTWTIYDVKKRETAKQNNLNYKEVWTLEEGKDFIDELYDKMTQKKDSMSA